MIAQSFSEHVSQGQDRELEPLRSQVAWAALLLLAIVFVAFSPAFTAAITDWDDSTYLRAAAEPPGWQLTHFVLGNYHPLTMWSLWLQTTGGASATGLHAVNVAIHGATSVLVLLLLLRFVPSLLAALGGALFFAVHPLRVESVVWIAERKDVLATLFLVLAVSAFLSRTRRGGGLGWVYLFFLLGLMAKGSIVTLPVILVAIEWEEKRRVAWLEKVPLFAISLAFGILAIAGQRSEGAVKDLPGMHLGIGTKFLVVAHEFVRYAVHEVLPLHLSAYYPYPATLDWTFGAALAVLLPGVLLICMLVYGHQLATLGVIWFVVTLAPLLPIVSIGGTVAADRYTYVPSIGLAILVTLALARLQTRSLMMTRAVIVAFGAVLALATFIGSQNWHDDLTLWSSVIAEQPRVEQAYDSRGVALVRRGQFAAARSDFDQAISLRPCYALALSNRASLHALTGRMEAARADMAAITTCTPDDPEAWHQRAVMLEKMGFRDEARVCLIRERSLRHPPAPV